MDAIGHNFLIARFAINRTVADCVEHKINSIVFHDGAWLMLVIAPDGQLAQWRAVDVTVLDSRHRPDPAPPAPIRVRTRP